MVALRFRIDEKSRLLFIDLDSGVSAQKAMNISLDLFDRRPELWSWDWIVQATVVPEDASIDHMARLARAHVGHERVATSVLVSHDRALHLWARVMDFQFPGRRHTVVRSVEEGLDRLGLPRRLLDGPADRLDRNPVGKP